MKKIKNK